MIPVLIHRTGAEGLVLRGSQTLQKDPKNATQGSKANSKSIQGSRRENYRGGGVLELIEVSPHMGICGGDNTVTHFPSLCTALMVVSKEWKMNIMFLMV